VREIRKLEMSGRGAYEIGVEYGVTEGAIYSIWRRKSWAWLSDDPADDDVAA
jgi:hypothetical protein